MLKESTTNGNVEYLRQNGHAQNAREEDVKSAISQASNIPSQLKN